MIAGKFHDAERVVLSMVEDALAKEYNTEDDTAPVLAELKGLYEGFNDRFDDWADLHGFVTESSDLRNHHNLLMAHCSDPASMDDLLYETLGFLTDPEDDQQLEEARYHLSCYPRPRETAPRRVTTPSSASLPHSP
jgi:hypothetical protein